MEDPKSADEITGIYAILYEHNTGSGQRPICCIPAPISPPAASGKCTSSRERHTFPLPLHPWSDIERHIAAEPKDGTLDRHGA